MRLTFTLEQPHSTATQDPLTIRVEGWLHGAAQHAEIVGVEAYDSDHLLGRSEILFPRPEIAKVFQLDPTTPLGFSLSLNAPSLIGRTTFVLELRVLLRDGLQVLGAKRKLALMTLDHRKVPYGGLLNPDVKEIFHRDHIYGSGPSVSEIDADCLRLVKRYLGSSPRRVLDVGCGFGGYGRALLAAGHDWLGVELKASDCQELSRQGLPHQQVDGRGLPFADGSFDDAICIEVLEHIEKPYPFLAEIRRVVKRRLLVSVPNLELIPYLFQDAVVPWHLLEADHKNFFSRTSLRHLLEQHFRKVEVLDYGPLPTNSVQEMPLHVHLFAICDG